MKTITLSNDELRLVIELLEAERAELPVEIHHTDAPRVHDDLISREALVKSLLSRVVAESKKIGARSQKHCSCEQPSSANKCSSENSTIKSI